MRSSKIPFPLVNRWLNARGRFHSSLLAASLLVAGLGALTGCAKHEPDREDDGMGSVQQHWWIFGGDSHGNQAKEALWFLKPAVRDALADFDEATDSKHPDGKRSSNTKIDSRYHFDNCRFTEATTAINEHYTQIVKELPLTVEPFSLDSTPWKDAMAQFGYVIHASQDFYAHSNWVESGQDGLVDSGLDSWHVAKPYEDVGKGMVFAEGTSPNLTGAQLAAESHLLHLSLDRQDNNGSQQVLGLMTGRYDNGGDSAWDTKATACLEGTTAAPLAMDHGEVTGCKPSDVKKVCPECDGRDRNQESVVCGEIWRKTYLAKDFPPKWFPGTSPPADVKQRTRWRDAAHELAKEQTTHEFCRLRSMLAAEYGQAGCERLNLAWVDDITGADIACQKTCGETKSTVLGGFADATASSGLTGVRGTRLSVADLNGDDYPDLIVRDASDEESVFDDRGDQQRVWLLINNGKGQFTDATKDSGFTVGRVRADNRTVRGGRASQITVFADINNDGFLDAFAGTSSYTPTGLKGSERSEILMNDGTGKFKLVADYPFGTEDIDPGAATFLDYDADGHVDLLVTARTKRLDGYSAWLFHGTGDPEQPFKDVTKSSGLKGPAPFTQSSIACDLDNDGTQELLLGALARGPNSLWRALPGGGFEDRGIDSHYAHDEVGDWKDDLRAQAYCSYLADKRVAVQYVSESHECQALSGCPANCSKFPCDFVRDAQPSDQTSVCNGMRPYPASSPGTKFRDALLWKPDRDTVPERLGGNTISTLCADFDGDGYLDLFNAAERRSVEGSSADSAQVLQNTSKSIVPPGVPPTFARLSQGSTGLEIAPPAQASWVDGVNNAESFDFDNDGQPDLLIDGADAKGASGRLYLNTTGTGSIRFTPLPMAGLERARGIAVADFDRDGDLDFVVGYSTFHRESGETLSDPQIHLFRNDLTGQGQWIQLRLEGIGTPGRANKMAIGAHVTVTGTGIKTLVQEVDGGHGHFGAQGDRWLHFGLGSATGKVHIQVRWPNAAHSLDTFDLQPGARYLLREGASPAAPEVTIQR